MERIVKVALGKIARTGVETHLGSDVLAGVRLALSDYARQIGSDSPPVGVPGFAKAAAGAGTVDLELAVDEGTMAVLEREAGRQGATVGQLAAHAVLVYLAELERLAPSGATG